MSLRACVIGLLVIFLGMGAFTPASAQVTVIQIGTQYYINYTMFYAYYSPDFRTQWIFTRAEMNQALQAAGLPPDQAFLKSMSLQTYYWYGNANYTYDDNAITMSHTTLPYFDWNPPYQFEHHIDPVDVFTHKAKTFTTNYQDWQKFTFDNVFQWNGSDNILIDYCYHIPAGYYTAAYTYIFGSLQPWYYPPYYHESWFEGQVAGGSGCGYPTIVNGWIDTKPIAQFEVCTGSPTQFSYGAPNTVYIPGTVPVNYSIYHPSVSFTATLTIRFYTPADQLVYTESTTVPVVAGTTSTGVYNVNPVGLAPGFYRIEITANLVSPCGTLADYKYNLAIMALSPGQIPCEVWPGDVNRDDIVNWADRNALNTYIHDANLNPLWLNGPARYRVDQAVDPLTYVRWEEQVSVPWYTPEGCYMDADGNGTVNSFDFLAIKLNWMHVTSNYTFTKDASKFNTSSFDLEQNYPNPFNPTTVIRYNVPEASQVSLVVTDVLGRTVATLVDEKVESGVHSASFDASKLTSGNYIATVRMTGVTSGQTFTKTIKMTLAK